MFDSNKQTKAFKKIADTHNNIMKEKDQTLKQAMDEQLEGQEGME
jgi:hypothetical protein